MANCNKLFSDFAQEISLSPTQEAELKRARTALQNVISAALKDNDNVSFRGFYIQGSQSPAFRTAILRSKDKTYDVDLGIYLWEKPQNITCTTAQKYILDAVSGHTDAGAKHLSKCIRVVYAGAFDIDLVLYYQGENGMCPFLAVKNGSWREDDPKGTAEWFRTKKKGTKGQLVRIIKYLKAWADKDLRGFKMPSGFAFTVWAAENFVADESRDDKALLETLKRIRNAVYWGVNCIAPRTPFDNLTDDLDDNQKQKFKNALDLFITDAQKAIDSNNQLDASKLWQKHLGDRFKDGADEDVDEKEKQLRSVAAVIISGSAKTDSSGKIQGENGVSNKSHRNHGG